MKVLVTGATGFVGREVVRQLAAAGHAVLALVRKGSEDKLPPSLPIEIRHGDVTEAARLADALDGCDAVIHLVGIIREFPGRRITYQRLHVEANGNLLAAAKQQGVQRLVQMSANGTGPEAKTGYHRTKWQAEQAVRDSDLDWTIFRPSLIFGRGGEFVEMLAGMIRSLPLVPVIGDGRYRMQPVAVEQVAESLVKSLQMPQTISQTYLLGGGGDYSYNEILDLTGATIGVQPVRKIHQPVLLMKPVVQLMQNASCFPITSDQLTMLLAGNVCDPSVWAETFGIVPLSYAEGIGACFSEQHA
ncbi:MAG: hypothetical protein C0614_01040 [Desulfuromonas sp.]|nr:MAG: hypothetical protein C0614_01040 [Desulfuromonas sp.]